ncbi:HET-domain-containing protein [Plenodomus tracheiphilus IPT5]|uniref:HET-domain-containing protein n=1 Tax=Plenodomus tracheiphilus IPT5 TaxID=1408161 RepID=A0A6A7BAJ4_9PLEO|nr:HET-domain-containing protein [Plenodomus tracheiphilus IPT5]
MRLLTRDENGALRLQSFHRDIPLYTILSHRWLPEEEEVTFQDIAAGTGTSKRGYFKLQFCADEAAKLGITHFWADTCCIDKSSSSELQEAIDSMYRWYRSALVCFVYMSDVVHNPSLRSLASGHGEFEHSSWFQRGWTLQELLAPALVFFYSQDKKFLGTKESLKQAIINATGIPAKALEGQPLSSFSVDERMSWAEGRSTTREEDRSYCLLGIFGIHMPLIYGEGECAARRRLLEEIQNASTRRHASHTC